MSWSTSSTAAISRFTLSLDTLGSSYAIHRSAWRNCLENSLRRLSAPLWRQDAPELGLLPPLLAALGAPIRDLSRISKQFRKGNSQKFVRCVALEAERPGSMSS